MVPKIEMIAPAQAVRESCTLQLGVPMQPMLAKAQKTEGPKFNGLKIENFGGNISWFGKSRKFVASNLGGSVSKPCTPGEHQNGW